jgi:acyl carrier protein
VIVPAAVTRSPHAFLKLLGQQQVTVVNQTPSAASQLLIVAQGQETSVRRLFVGGEALPTELAQSLMKTGIPLVNFYGPTEATVWAAIKTLEPGAPVTIGRPIANYELYVLDRAGRIVPAGVVGELHIGGAGLGRGYWKRPELTAQSFIPHPYSDVAGERLYRTGDLARYRADGEIEYVGRADYQVKVRGFRIELGEIEAALMDHAQVREAIAMVRENRLVAFVTANGQLSSNELRESVSRRLPEYMVPNGVLVLERLPQTANGKIDRQALAELQDVSPETVATYEPPRNELERQIAAAWMEALKIDKVGVDQNFFDLGGHSMLLAQVHLRLQTSLGRELALVDFFKYPTVSSLAQFISHEAREETSAVEIDARTEERKDKLKKQRQTRRKARSAAAAHGDEHS